MGDGEEVKQLDDEMKGVLARLREIFAQEEVVKYRPSSLASGWM